VSFCGLTASANEFFYETIEQIVDKVNSCNSQLMSSGPRSFDIFCKASDKANGGQIAVWISNGEVTMFRSKAAELCTENPGAEPTLSFDEFKFKDLSISSPAPGHVLAKFQRGSVLIKNCLSKLHIDNSVQIVVPVENGSLKQYAVKASCKVANENVCRASIGSSEQNAKQLPETEIPTSVKQGSAGVTE